MKGFLQMAARLTVEGFLQMTTRFTVKSFLQMTARLTVKSFLRMAARLTVKEFLQLTAVTVHALFHQQKRGEQTVLLPMSCVNACAAGKCLFQEQHGHQEKCQRPACMHCRRKMNRESARRTRQRKQEQTVSLQAEVCILDNQANMCTHKALHCDQA